VSPDCPPLRHVDKGEASGAREPAAQGAVVVTGTTVRLTTNPAPQIDPSISGNNLVWTDQRNGNDDIYYCDVSDCGGTEVQVTTC
jgi:beta propeller repeat protein